MQGICDLWSAVVSQAQHDIESASLKSIVYEEAVAFFSGGGDWAKSRRMIAEAINLHEDDLVKCGRRWIAARRRLEGLPDAAPPREVPTGPPPPLPALEAVPTPRPPPRPRRYGHRWEYNPFNPLLAHTKHLIGPHATARNGGRISAAPGGPAPLPAPK